jgi:hypothetical protein
LALDPTIKRTLTSTIYVAARTSVSTGGDPTFGSPAARRARVETRPVRVLNGLGEEVTSAAQIVVEAEILLTDRVWLPGRDRTKPNESVVPIRVDRAFDERGAISHFVAYFG